MYFSGLFAPLLCRKVETRAHSLFQLRPKRAPYQIEGCILELLPSSGILGAIYARDRVSFGPLFFPMLLYYSGSSRFEAIL
jgi:hypothetical protein